MIDGQSEPERKPAKPEDLDFKTLANELTTAPEVVDKRVPPVETPEAKKVTGGSAVKNALKAEDVAGEDQGTSGTAAPCTPAEAKPGALGKAMVEHPELLLGDADEVPDHSGQRRAGTDRLLEMIVYRAAERLEHLLAHLPELPLMEQARVMSMVKDILVEMHDIHITRQWTRRLQAVILERFTLLQQTKSNGLRKVASYAAQAGKELKADGRTTAARNKKAAVGRLAPGDLPAAEA